MLVLVQQELIWVLSLLQGKHLNGSLEGNCDELVVQVKSYHFGVSVVLRFKFESKERLVILDVLKGFVDVF